MGFGSGTLFVVTPPEGALDTTITLRQTREDNGFQLTLDGIHFSPALSTAVVLAPSSAGPSEVTGVRTCTLPRAPISGDSNSHGRAISCCRGRSGSESQFQHRWRVMGGTGESQARHDSTWDPLPSGHSILCRPLPRLSRWPLRRSPRLEGKMPHFGSGPFRCRNRIRDSARPLQTLRSRGHIGSVHARRIRSPAPTAVLEILDRVTEWKQTATQAGHTRLIAPP